TTAVVLVLSFATRSLSRLTKFIQTIARCPAARRLSLLRCLPPLNSYLLLFRVPMLPSVRPRWLPTSFWSASATDQGALPAGWIPPFLPPAFCSFSTVCAQLPPRS